MTQVTMDNLVRDELWALYGKVQPQAVAGVLRRIEQGRIEGDYYTIIPANSTVLRPALGAPDEWEELPCGCIKGSSALENHEFNLNDPNWVLDAEVRNYLYNVLEVNLGIEPGNLETFVGEVHYGDTPETNGHSYELYVATAEYMRQHDIKIVKGE